MLPDLRLLLIRESTEQICDLNAVVYWTALGIIFVL